jgi:hypothetical protein
MRTQWPGRSSEPAEPTHDTAVIAEPPDAGTQPESNDHLTMQFPGTPEPELTSSDTMIFPSGQWARPDSPPLRYPPTVSACSAGDAAGSGVWRARAQVLPMVAVPTTSRRPGTASSPGPLPAGSPTAHRPGYYPPAAIQPMAASGTPGPARR